MHQAPLHRIVGHIVQLFQAFLLAINTLGIETALPDTIARVAVNGGRRAQAGQHPAAPGMRLILSQDRDNPLRGSFLQLLPEAAGALSRLGLDQEVKVLWHQNPADEQKTRRNAELRSAQPAFTAY